MEKQLKQIFKLVNAELKRNKDRDVLRSWLLIKAILEELDTLTNERRCELK
jgi:hypothetical protein